MTMSVEAWYREKYLSKVTYKYNNAGFLLKPLVTPPAEMDGKKLYFPVSLPGEAAETKRGDDVKTMNAGKELKEVVAKRYEAAEYVYKFDINKTSATEMEVNTKNAADALGQRHDRTIMDAIHAGAGGYGAVIGSFAAGWDLSKAFQAETALRRRCDNPREYAYCVLPILAFNQMLTFKEFNNSDYVGDYPLAKGVQARTWGFTHYVAGYDRLFSGYRAGENGVDVTFYYWFPHAIGSGGAGGIETDINYVPIKRAWLHDNTLEAGSTVLLPEAIQECRFKGDSTVAFA